MPWARVVNSSNASHQPRSMPAGPIDASSQSSSAATATVGAEHRVAEPRVAPAQHGLAGVGRQLAEQPRRARRRWWGTRGRRPTSGTTRRGAPCGWRAWCRTRRRRGTRGACASRPPRPTRPRRAPSPRRRPAPDGDRSASQPAAWIDGEPVGTVPATLSITKNGWPSTPVSVSSRARRRHRHRAAVRASASSTRNSRPTSASRKIWLSGTCMRSTRSVRSSTPSPQLAVNGIVTFELPVGTAPWNVTRPPPSRSAIAQPSGERGVERPAHALRPDGVGRRSSGERVPSWSRPCSSTWVAPASRKSSMRAAHSSAVPTAAPSVSQCAGQLLARDCQLGRRHRLELVVGESGEPLVGTGSPPARPGPTRSRRRSTRPARPRAGSRGHGRRRSRSPGGRGRRSPVAWTSTRSGSRPACSAAASHTATPSGRPRRW